MKRILTGLVIIAFGTILAPVTTAHASPRGSYHGCVKSYDPVTHRTTSIGHCPQRQPRQREVCRVTYRMVHYLSWHWRVEVVHYCAHRDSAKHGVA